MSIWDNLFLSTCFNYLSKNKNKNNINNSKRRNCEEIDGKKKLKNRGNRNLVIYIYIYIYIYKFRNAKSIVAQLNYFLMFQIKKSRIQNIILP